MVNALCEHKIYDSEIPDFNTYYGEIVGKRILDVGCGTGNLGSRLIRQGNECFGMTISKEEAGIARGKLSGVLLGDIELVQELPFDQNYFDVVVFSDVLEHLRKPKYVLELAKPHLKPGGLVIASIPNVANFVVRLNLLRGKFEYKEYGILDNTHLRFYTLETAKKLIESSGYLIQDIKFTNWNWRFSKTIQRLFSFCEWEVRQKMTRWWPGLFATQFVIYAYRNGETEI